MRVVRLLMLHLGRVPCPTPAPTSAAFVFVASIEVILQFFWLFAPHIPKSLHMHRRRVFWGRVAVWINLNVLVLM